MFFDDDTEDPPVPSLRAAKALTLPPASELGLKPDEVMRPGAEQRLVDLAIQLLPQLIDITGSELATATRREVPQSDQGSYEDSLTTTGFVETRGPLTFRVTRNAHSGTNWMTSSDRGAWIVLEVDGLPPETKLRLEERGQGTFFNDGRVDAGATLILEVTGERARLVVERFETGRCPVCDGEGLVPDSIDNYAYNPYGMAPCPRCSS